jgi:hypothetical protein
VSVNANLNAYDNRIAAFTVENQYPVPVTYAGERLQNYTGNLKLNALFRFGGGLEVQATGVYLAPDVVPQGRTASRYSVDLGAKKAVQHGKGELFFNAADLFNTLRIEREITTDGVRLTSIDLYETQIIRLGYSYKF